MVFQSCDCHGDNLHSLSVIKVMHNGLCFVYVCVGGFAVGFFWFVVFFFPLN